jgi:hypothetical protein
MIANLATQFIMGHNSMTTVDNFFVQTVTVGSSDLDYDRLIHFVAGNNTSHATTIVHASPSI